MSADSHGGGDGKPKISPLLLLGFAAAAGFGFYLLALFFGMGVEAIGLAKRRFPEVVLGIILLGFIGAGFAISRSEKGGGDKH